LLSLGALAAFAADPPKAPAPAARAGAASTSVATAAPAVTAAASAPPADAAKDKQGRQARAVELHDEAKALYDRGLYRRAIAKLEAALELDADGKELVYNLALIHEKLIEPEIAERYYLRYIEMETDPKARERATAIVKRLQAAKKSLKADVQERALASASAASAAPSGGFLGGSGPISRRPSPMVLVLGGVAVAAAAVGIGFGVSALSTHPDGLTTNARTTAYDLETRAQSAHTQAIVADLAFLTSVVVGATTGVLYLLETRSPPPAPAPAASRATARLRVEVPF
jgi:tetratricopeptide (TPR) repeat protein